MRLGRTFSMEEVAVDMEIIRTIKRADEKGYPQVQCRRYR